MMNALEMIRDEGLSAFFSSFGAHISAKFSHFGVADAFDILVTAGVFFLLLIFLHKRKCVSAVIGIGCCTLLYGIGCILGLRLFTESFRSVFTFLPIVLVILFASEIRDGMERIGTVIVGLFNSSRAKKLKKEIYSTVIDNICKAVAVFSDTRVGALIVIENLTRLDDIISFGTPIDARPEPDLLRNIFFNKAPLHDGAAIIRDGRVAAAGCVLPNTRRENVDPDLGTRHRAALGMSEVSDAFIIVVSEETGIISVAHDSALQRGYSPDTLRLYLTKKLVGSVSDR